VLGRAQQRPILRDLDRLADAYDRITHRRSLADETRQPKQQV
jgi:hypothetical protein